MNEAIETPKSNRRWLVVAAVLVLSVVLSFGVMFFFAGLFGPAVKSIDEIDDANVAKLSVLAINRPDGGPDITAGGAQVVQVPDEEVANVLKPLRGATEISAKRPVFLGRLQVVFKDGRKVTVMLHREASDEDGAGKLQYRIGDHVYEVAALAPFLKSLDVMEARLKK